MSETDTKRVKSDAAQQDVRHTPGPLGMYFVQDGWIMYRDPRQDNAISAVLHFQLEGEKADLICELLNQAHARGCLDMLHGDNAAAPSLLAAAEALQAWSWTLPLVYREANEWKALDAALAQAKGAKE